MPSKHELTYRLLVKLIVEKEEQSHKHVNDIGEVPYEGKEISFVFIIRVRASL